MKIYLNLPNRVAVEKTDGTWQHLTNVFWLKQVGIDTFYKTMGEQPRPIEHVKEINILAGCEIIK